MWILIMKKIFVLWMVMFCAIVSEAKASDGSELVYVPYIGMDYAYAEANAKNVRPNLNAFSFNIGSDYNRFFSTEVFYQFSDVSKKKLSTQESLKSSFQAGGLDVYGYLPLLCDRDLALIGTAGVGLYDFRNKYSNPYVKDGHDQGYGYRLGAGMFYSLNKDWAVRAVARYVKLDQIKDFDHMWEYSAGLRYTF